MDQLFVIYANPNLFTPFDMNVLIIFMLGKLSVTNAVLIYKSG